MKAKNLVGYWFHRPVDGSKTNFNQGQIIRKINELTYEVQLYSFADGLPNGKERVPVGEMEDYELFRSDVEMRQAYYRRMNISARDAASCEEFIARDIT